ncbi:MAG: FAD:protein FMN transferase [Candidatus Solibacter sp.]
MTSSSVFAVCLFTVLPLPAAALQLFEAVEPHMGTLVRIQLYARDTAQADAAFRAAFTRIAQLDAALSDYRDDSEVNRLCRAAVNQPVPISADLYAVLDAALQLAAETEGAFDPTLGPVTALWRVARKQRRLPDGDLLRAAVARTGYRHLHLDPRAQTATLDIPDMRLDLGGIAKGYAADEALAALGLPTALVAISGDLAIGAPPPGKQGWRIEIGSTKEVRTLSNTAVSTSGDTEQHLDVGGQRYSHVVDPQTGRGLTTGRMITVIARRGIDADSWSTALSVLDPARYRILLAQHPTLIVVE